jgi:hypothetical protein
VVHGGPVGKGEGGEPLEARVRSLGVVVDPPKLERPLSCRQALEQVLVQAFVAQPAIRLSTKPFCIGLPGAM